MKITIVDTPKTQAESLTWEHVRTHTGVYQRVDIKEPAYFVSCGYNFVLLVGAAYIAMAVDGAWSSELFKRVNKQAELIISDIR